MYFFLRHTLVILLTALCAVSHVPRCATIYKMMALFESSSESHKMHCHHAEEESKIDFKNQHLKKKPDCECKTYKFVKAAASPIIRSHDVSLKISLPDIIASFSIKTPKSIHLSVDPPPPRTA